MKFAVLQVNFFMKIHGGPEDLQKRRKNINFSESRVRRCKFSSCWYFIELGASLLKTLIKSRFFSYSCLLCCMTSNSFWKIRQCIIHIVIIVRVRTRLR